VAGEVSLKERFVDGDVLDTDAAAVALDLDDAIDQEDAVRAMARARAMLPW